MKFSAFRTCALVGLTGVALVGFYSHAQPAAVAKSAPPVAVANNKVIIYPTGSETLDQLKANGITKVTNYGSYWLVEATDAQVDQITRIFGARAVKENELNRIRLRNLSFDTTEGEPTVPAGLRQEDGPGKHLRLIQFRGPVVPQWLQQVQSVGNVEVISYVPNDAYLIRVDQPTEEKLRALEGPGGPIQWLGPYHPYYKIQPGLWTEGDQKNDSLVNVGVMVAPHTENSDTMKAIEKIGLVEYSYTRANETAQFLTVPVSTIAQMARLPDVIWIEKEYPKKLLDEVQDLVLAGQTNGLGHGPEGATTGFTNYLDFLFTQVAGDQIDAFVNPFTYPVVDVADTGIDSGPFGGTVTFGTNSPDSVEAPVHPAFHYFGDARNFSRVEYYGPPWLAGDPTPQLGCSVYFGANDGAFKHIESMDLIGHGTAVASIIAGYDDGTNIVNQPCLELVSFSNTVVVPIPFGFETPTSIYSCTNIPGVNGCISVLSTDAVPAPTNLVICLEIIGGPTNLTFTIPTGVSETCGPNGTPPNATFTNVTVAISSNSCPTNIVVGLLYTAVVTNNLNQIRVDADGYQFGMGISPFGLLGNSRIWENYQTALTVSGPPGSAGFGVLGGNNGCQNFQFLVDTGKCITDIPSLLALAYFANARETPGARIQNNSWSDDIGIPPLGGGQYDADCVSYDIGVRDALLVGDTNNVPVPIPGPSPLNQEFIVVFACSSQFLDVGNNSGVGGFPDIFITAPATAKNVISVGVADNPRLVDCGGGDSQEMPTFAENGPTLDGRFKPEIVAPGANVAVAISQIVAVTTNCSLDKTLFPTYPGIVACTNPPCDGTQGPIYTDLYGCAFGSSYAAPAVSGAIQLLWWYFQNRLTNEVGDVLLQPSPAMAKAYVCNSARYLPISYTLSSSNVVLDTLPSILQGMGELDLGRMFDGVGRAIRDESTPRAISVPLITTNPAVQQTYFSQSGQSYELTGQIASNGLPFRATVAWIDAPGTPQAAKELVNDLDLQVTIPYPGGVTYKGNVFAQNVSVPGGSFDTVNNMESVFLNPIGLLGGIAAVTSGAPFQVIVRASNIAGQGVPNIGETLPGSSNVLNQDFALVVYNVKTNTLSDVPNLGLQTNNSCQTAMILTNFPFTFANTLTNSVYANVQPSPTAATGGYDEFFKIPQPTAGTAFELDTFGSSNLDTVLSVWEVQVLPSTVFVRGECGYLTEVASANDPTGAGRTIIQQFIADGTNDYYIVAEGRNGAMGNLVLNVNRKCTVTLTPASLPSSRLGVFYSAQLFAAGGTPPFTFSISPTNGLPPGLTLSQSTGAIGGVPTATGSFTFTITATDALGCTASRTYTVTIACPSLTLSPTTLPAALDGQAYSNVISAIGGQNPITFSLAVGPLPPGLTLSSSGLLSGIPQVVEAPSTNRLFSFKVQAVDTNGCSGSLIYTISVNCPNIAITNSQNSFPVGTEFQPYPGVQLGATGGTVTVTSPYVFSQTGGSLPAGMGLTSGGMITGTPTSVSSSFTVTVTDNNGCKGSRTYTLPLNDPVPPTNTTTTVLNVGPPSLSAGVVGQNYVSTFGASGGNGSYSFAVSSGALPTGLNLSSAGALTGIPTTDGTFGFTITATDTSSDSGSMTYAVTVTSEADLAVSAAALNPQTVVIGSNLTCSVTVTNLGPAPATGVTVSNLLPSGVSFVSASTGCTADGSTVVCDIGSLASGTSAEITYVVTATATGTVSFTASVTGDQTDVNLANNTVTFTGTVKSPYTVASNPKAITDVDGDIVSVTLKGKGTMEVRVLGGDNRGPIDQIVLTGTTASSTLTIQVKKHGGDGFVSIGSIVSDGSLSAINGKAVNVTGAGIQVAGSLGSLTVNALSNTTVSVGGTLGTVQLQSMSGSACTVTGTIKSIAAKSYSASTISAAKVLGAVKLGTVTGGAANQITVQQSGGTVSVANPRTKPWKITASTQQGGVQVIVGP